ncbi:MAG: hypothetical protein WAN31_05905 [Methylovirgula sp.]
MSVLPSDVVIYGCADMPEADSASVGGAIDFTKRIDFSDISPNGTMDAVSSSASDTATKFQVTGRDATGAVVTPAAGTLNGTTPVTGIGSSQTFERLLAAVITGGAIAGLSSPGGTAAVGDMAIYAHTPIISGHTAQAGSANHSGTTPALVKLQSGDGSSVAVGQIIRIKSNTGVNQLRRIIATSGYGTDIVAVNRDWSTPPDATSTYDVYEGMLFEILPNPVLAITRLFATAAADIAGGSQRIFYEKGFVVNNNTATALTPVSPNTGVGVEISGESPTLPSGVLLDLGLGAGFDDSLTIANRQTAPSGISFVMQPAYVYAPSPGNLAPGSAPNVVGALAVWLRLTVPAGGATYKGAPTIQTNGNTV